MNHENVVKTYDFILEKTNHKGYIVQEFVEGKNLNSLTLGNINLTGNITN